MMTDVQKSYSRMVNFREGWRGYLWQGRYFSCPMDENYTLRTARYIELNPVKARMVTDFGEYPYSSAGFHLGKYLNDPVIRDPYFDFSYDRWRDFVLEGLNEEEIENDSKEIENSSGRPLGDISFIERLEEITGKVLKKKKTGPKSV